MVKSTSHGFHSFRRFRDTHLSEMECNSDVKLFWMGWSPKTMAEVYSRLVLRCFFNYSSNTALCLNPPKIQVLVVMGQIDNDVRLDHKIPAFIKSESSAGLGCGSLSHICGLLRV